MQLWLATNLHKFNYQDVTAAATLLGAGNGHSVIEVTPEKKIVWSVKQNDLPGIQLRREFAPGQFLDGLILLAPNQCDQQQTQQQDE